MVERNGRVELSDCAVVRPDVDVEGLRLLGIGQGEQLPRGSENLIIVRSSGLHQNVADAGLPRPRLGLLGLQRLHCLAVAPPTRPLIRFFNLA